MKLINRTVLFILWAFCLSLTSMKALAANDVSALTGKSGTSEEFLPVEQAYKVNVIQEGNAIYLDWTIAKGYYLYKEKFKIFAQTEQSKTPSPLRLKLARANSIPTSKRRGDIPRCHPRDPLHRQPAQTV